MDQIVTDISASVKITFHSHPLEVRLALRRMRDGLSKLGLLPEELGSVEIVVAEVLNNISEHAYEERPDGKIEMALIPSNAQLHCSVVDHGKPMPNGQTPLGKAHDLDVEMDDLPEGGFGWFLIGELAHDLTYERKGEENHLTFKMQVGAPS